MNLKIFVIFLILLFVNIFSDARWVFDKRLFDSINKTTRGKRDFIGEIAVGKMTVKSCNPGSSDFPSYSVAKKDKNCWDDSEDGILSDVRYICDDNAKILYFGNPGEGFISNTEITLMSGMESTWTTGKAPGIPTYSRCEAKCQVGYCSDHCTAACTEAATCSDNDVSPNKLYFIVPQSVTAEGTDVTNCGGQGKCCKSHKTVANYDNVDSYTPPIKVLLLHADDSANVNDVKSKLLAVSSVFSINEFDIRFTSPTIDDLKDYHSILLWTNFPPANRAVTGDVIADYIDGGGGVVSAMLQVAGSTTFAVRGNFIKNEYQVITFGGYSFGTKQILGTVYDNTHPLMNGVTSFDGGNGSIRPLNDATFKSGSIKVADWDDGCPLIVYRDNAGKGGNKKRVDLGFNPVSSDASGDLNNWDPKTDGAKIIRNALLYVANPNLKRNVQQK